MALIFISHASRDDTNTDALQGWLRQHGFDDAFVDHDNIGGGDKWASALRQAAGSCRVVICLVTPNWLASSECYAEFNAAWYLGKRIIPLFALASDPPLSQEAKARLAKVQAEDQGFDLRTCMGGDGHLDLDRDERLARLLAQGLRAAGALSTIGLDPLAFEINRAARVSPFPGLLSFGDDDADAALLYGRSREIAETLEELRKLRASGGRRPFGILGASGAGKSSLLKAGVIPRLRREIPAWLPLRSFRPGEDPLLNFAEALSKTFADVGDVEAHGIIRDRLLAAWRTAARGSDGRLDASGLATLQAAMLVEAERLRRAANRPDATVLICIDQAEELAQEEGESGDVLSDCLRAAMAAAPGIWLVAFTCRTDSFAELQAHRRLKNLDTLCYDLRALPVFRFDAVVEEPAKRYGVTVDPQLIDTLMHDAPGDDALPLLAFALQRLWSQYAAAGRVVNEHYLSMGGLAGIIEGAAERALCGIEPGQDAPLKKSALTENLNKLGAATFVPALADLNDAGRVVRKAASWDRFTPEQQELLARFDRWRLVTRRGKDGGTVEVAHEKLFDNWPRLQNEWLTPERGRLQALRELRSAAAAWQMQDKRRDYLAHDGRRLQEARALLGKSDYSNELGEQDRAYLEACRKKRLAIIFGLSGFGALALIYLAGFVLVTVLSGMRQAENVRSLLGVVAVAAGNSQADHDFGRKTLEEVAAKDKGGIVAFLLGVLYENGTVGTPKDIAQALRWYEQAAASGNSGAVMRLVVLHLYGRDIPRDTDKAMRWIEMIPNDVDPNFFEQLGVALDGGSFLTPAAPVTDYRMARAMYEKGALQDHQRSIEALALMSMRGKGGDQDFVAARKLYERAAAKHKSIEAMQMLSHIYRKGYGVPADLQKAGAWFEQAADVKGASTDKLQMAHRYATGDGVEKNRERALLWLKRASADGDAYVQGRIGEVYERDLKEGPQAIESYEKAIAAGGSHWMWSLVTLYAKGELVPKNESKAHELLERYAASGNAKIVARIYEDLGKSGNPRNYERARHWYAAALDKGDATVAGELGRMLVEGLGGPSDKDRALQLFEQAAQTDADAMTALGRRYEFGDGITKDLGKAVEWYQKAITAGNNSYSTRGAFFALGSLAIKEAPPDLEKVESLFEKAEGPRNLALRFLDGDGLAQNYAKARVWLEKGISLDSPKAAMFLAALLESGQGGPRDPDRAHELRSKELALAERSVEWAENDDWRYYGEPGHRTSMQLSRLCWVLVAARKFDAAVVVSERAAALGTTSLWEVAQRGHALMLAGRPDEARTIYITHRGKVEDRGVQAFVASQTPWEKLITNDFADLGRLGLTHPLMDEIRDALSGKR